MHVLKSAVSKILYDKMSLFFIQICHFVINVKSKLTICLKKVAWNGN